MINFKLDYQLQMDVFQFVHEDGIKERSECPIWNWAPEFHTQYLSFSHAHDLMKKTCHMNKIMAQITTEFSL